MAWKLASAIALLIALAPLRAAGEAACAGISDDAERLACYDAAWRPAAQAPAGWQLRESVSAWDGSPDLRASRLAVAPHTDRFGAPVRASLNLACREGALAVWVHFGGAYLDERDGGNRMSYRLDEEAPRAREFQVSRDRRSLGAFTDRGARLLLAELEGHDRLVVRATPFRTRTVTAAFELTGMAEPLARVRAACQ